MSERESLDWPGDLQALDGEIRRVIGRLCRRYGAAGEAEDVAQVIVMRIWANRERLRFENRSAFFGYIQRAVRHEVPHQLARSTGRGRIQLFDPTALAAVAPTAGDSRDDVPPPIEEMLALLPNEREREACRLHYVNELTQQAIGKHLGVSTPTACRLLEKARDYLRKKLRAAPGSQEAAR